MGTTKFRLCSSDVEVNQEKKTAMVEITNENILAAAALIKHEANK